MFYFALNLCCFVFFVLRSTLFFFFFFFRFVAMSCLNSGGEMTSAQLIQQVSRETAVSLHSFTLTLGLCSLVFVSVINQRSKSVLSFMVTCVGVRRRPSNLRKGHRSLECDECLSSFYKRSFLFCADDLLTYSHSRLRECAEYPQVWIFLYSIMILSVMAASLPMLKTD